MFDNLKSAIFRTGQLSDRFKQVVDAVQSTTTRCLGIGRKETGIDERDPQVVGAAFDRQIQDQQKRLEELDSARTLLEQQHKAAQRELDNAIREETSAQKEKKALEDYIKKQQENSEYNNCDLDQLRQKFRAANATLQAAETKRTEAQERVLEGQARIDRLEGLIAKLKTDIQELQELKVVTVANLYQIALNQEQSSLGSPAGDKLLEYTRRLVKQAKARRRVSGRLSSEVTGSVTRSDEELFLSCATNAAPNNGEKGMTEPQVTDVLMQKAQEK